MISNFNEEAKEILIKAKLEMLDLKHPYVGTEHLVLAILHTNNEITKQLTKYNLNYQRFKEEIIKIIGKGSKKSEFFLHTPLLKKVIENAIIDSKENNNGIVTTNHLFSSLLDIGEGIAIRTMLGMNIDIDSMYDEFSSKLYETNTRLDKKLLVEELGTDLNEKAKNQEIDPVIGREKEISEIEKILCRKNKNNPILIGEPGVGKTAIIEGLANLISEGAVPKQLSNKRIISLDMASAVAGTKYRGEFEERMKKIINEIENNDGIILFIDEIHTLIGAGGAEGAIDASNILKPALARGKIRCIGATTTSEYKKYFEKDKALERRFQKITIEEPSLEETKNILYKIKPIYEKYHNVQVDNATLDSLITISEKYINNRYRPDKQIDILDEVCSQVAINSTLHSINKNGLLKKLRNEKLEYINNRNYKMAYELIIKETSIKNNIKNINDVNKVTINDILTVISKKANIPFYEFDSIKEEDTNNIKLMLKEKIIGQNEAIDKLINITKKIKFDYTSNRSPSILFIGPHGTGKTKLALLFGKTITNQNIMKIDMSEFSDVSALNRFIGTSPGYIGYDNNNYILNKIKDNPGITLILDEIDKANPIIIDLIIKILKERKIKDSHDNTINLLNNTIIMTTNSGYNTKTIGFTNKQNNPISALKECFSKAFINNIDDIIVFDSLNKESIEKIIIKKINALKNKYDSNHIHIGKEIINEIIDASEYQEFGAKNINKIITNKLESIIINKIIDKQKEINIDSILT